MTEAVKAIVPKLQSSAALVSRFRYTKDMSIRRMARDGLWDVAALQLGYVTAQQAADLDIGKHAMQMLVHRQTLTRVAHGVYRFPKYPVGEYDGLMLAVLWTRSAEACLSHESALDIYGISDVNPNQIHVTVGRKRRLRRAGGENYLIHYEDLNPTQIGWAQEIPTVTPVTAIAQCISYGTPSYLLRQGIARGHAQGRLTTAERDALSEDLERRHVE